MIEVAFQISSTVLRSTMKTYTERHLNRLLGLTSLISVGVLLAIAASANSWMEGFGAGNSAIAAQEMADTLFEPTHSILVQAKLDLVDTALAHGSLNTMIQLMEDLDLAEDLRGFGPFIVFAPTDNAFAAVPADLMEDLQNDRELMAKVLAYHVVRVRTPIRVDEIRGTSVLRTLERSLIELRRRGGDILVNGAAIIEADIEATNGVIHIIDTVLIPSDVTAELR